MPQHIERIGRSANEKGGSPVKGCPLILRLCKAYQFFVSETPKVRGSVRKMLVNRPEESSVR